MSSLLSASLLPPVIPHISDVTGFAIWGVTLLVASALVRWMLRPRLRRMTAAPSRVPSAFTAGIADGQA